ncbi:MAG: GGDEF domain-containing protein [Eubacterium sp.]|nr:GGDEF domain-containing protein [Eubacterium sp.]
MNTAKYLATLENFICQLHQYPDSEPDQFPETVAELCQALRIGKLEAAIYENEAAEHTEPIAKKSFYDCGKAAKNVEISKKFNIIDGKLSVYNVYRIDGEPELTEEERERIDAFIVVISSFTGKSRFTKIIHRMTYYDNELDVYNINQFMKSANILIKTGQIFGYTVVRFNLKRFSVVNQHIGRDNGTVVMKKYVGIINDLLDGEFELTCRVGGDNFLTLVTNDKLQSVIDILNGTSVTYDEVRDERVFISATTGIYVIKDVGGVILPTDIMDRVSLAFQIAKNSPNTDVVFFDDAILARSKHNNDITALFPKALEDREFLVYYQPKVDIAGRHITGAEALCRWRHDGQLIPPGEFIPVLEQGLDICKLDFYILDAVCRDIRRWLDNGMHVVRVSVNLSRRHLSDIDLLKHIIEIVDRNNVPHNYIEIELTETTTDVGFKDLKRVIGGLQKSGFSTSVDDFGIGYTSLNLIKEIPWNVVKLDKSLLPAEGDENTVQKGVMFKYIVAMAQEMGLECISEGVETKEQVQLLSDNKCNLAQGFFFDRPLPVEEFETRLNKNYIYER